MHPLEQNLKSLSFEDLEKRSSEILKRMQILRRSQITTPEIWSQLELLLESVNSEKMERALLLNSSNSSKVTTAVNIDPLEDEVDVEAKSNTRGFNPIT